MWPRRTASCPSVTINPSRYSPRGPAPTQTSGGLWWVPTYAKSEQLFGGRKIIILVVPQPKQDDLCYDLLPVWWIELTHFGFLQVICTKDQYSVSTKKSRPGTSLADASIPLTLLGGDITKMIPLFWLWIDRVCCFLSPEMIWQILRFIIELWQYSEHICRLLVSRTDNEYNGHYVLIVNVIFCSSWWKLPFSIKYFLVNNVFLLYKAIVQI